MKTNKKNIPYKILNYGHGCIVFFVITNNRDKMRQIRLHKLSKPPQCYSLNCIRRPQFKTLHPPITTTITCFLLFLPLAAAQTQGDGFSDTNGLNQLSPSLAMMIVVLVIALLLLGFFSIYIRHCSGSPTITVGPHAGADNRHRKAARGLDRAVIDTFPILEYSVVKIHKIGNEPLECAICLCEFEDTETLRLIPKCDHVFHPECIDEWLSSHTTCPVCRANLVPQTGESVHALPIQNPESPSSSSSYSSTRDNIDIEAQNDVVGETMPEQQNMEAADVDRVLTNPEIETTPNQNRRRSRWNRPRRFPRSHSTGHSLVQPCENTERFTLRLPLEVRKRIINRQLKKASSFILLPRETSSREGYRIDGEGSSRGKISRLLNLSFKSDRWVFTMAPPFLVRASSPKVVNTAAEGTSSSGHTVLPSPAKPVRPPV